MSESGIRRLLRMGVANDNDDPRTMRKRPGQLGPQLSRRSTLKRTVRTEAMRRAGWACEVCGGGAHHIDHIIAHCMGGADTLENFQVLCVRCNHVKARRLDRFRGRLDRLPPVGSTAGTAAMPRPLAWMPA